MKKKTYFSSRKHHFYKFKYNAKVVIYQSEANGTRHQH